MSRIRTTKPEFCVSDPVLECSRDARLFFILLWNFCDDGGVHLYSLKRLKCEIFPADDDMTKQRIDELIQELKVNNLIIIYEIDGKQYVRVLGFCEHQKIDRPNYRLPWENGKIPIRKLVKTAEELDADTRDFLSSSRYRKDLKNFLIQRDGNYCSYCGSTTRTLTVDHVIPRSKGGSNKTTNLALACRQCNGSKGNKLGIGRRIFDDTQPDVNEENGTENNQTDQKIISTASVTSGREGKGSLLHNNNNININNISGENENNVEINDDVKKPKRGRKKLNRKWTLRNYEQIPDDIVVGFEQVYNPYPRHKARLEGLCAYANMNGGLGATEKEHQKMVKSVAAQKLEASLKDQAGKDTWWANISTWINNRRFEDEVDLSTPIQLKPKSTSNKFADNAAKAYGGA